MEEQERSARKYVPSNSTITPSDGVEAEAVAHPFPKQEGWVDNPPGPATPNETPPPPPPTQPQRASKHRHPSYSSDPQEEDVSDPVQTTPDPARRHRWTTFVCLLFVAALLVVEYAGVSGGAKDDVALQVVLVCVSVAWAGVYAGVLVATRKDGDARFPVNGIGSQCVAGVACVSLVVVATFAETQQNAALLTMLYLNMFGANLRKWTYAVAMVLVVLLVWVLQFAFSSYSTKNSGAGESFHIIGTALAAFAQIVPYAVKEKISLPKPSKSSRRTKRRTKISVVGEPERATQLDLRPASPSPGCDIEMSKSLELAGTPAVELQPYSADTLPRTSQPRAVNSEDYVENEFASMDSRPSDVLTPTPYVVRTEASKTVVVADVSCQTRHIEDDLNKCPRVRRTESLKNSPTQDRGKWSSDFTNNPDLGSPLRSGSARPRLIMGHRDRSDRRSSSDSLSSFVSFGASVAKTKNGAGFIALSDPTLPSGVEESGEYDDENATSPRVSDIEELQESVKGKRIMGMLRSETSNLLRSMDTTDNTAMPQERPTSVASSVFSQRPANSATALRQSTSQPQPPANLLKSRTSVKRPSSSKIVVSLSDARSEVRKLMSEDSVLLNNTTSKTSAASARLSTLPPATLSNIVNLISRLSEETDVVRSNYLIVAGVCAILRCDRASVFLVEGSTVRSFDAKGDSIVVPMDKSLVGHAALNCSILNIPDAYDDPRFNKQVDKETGYTTRNVLVYPITRSELRTTKSRSSATEGVFAVIEAINKIEGTFNSQDESILALLGKQAGVLLSNSYYCQQLESESYKTSTLLEVSKEISDVQVDLGIMMERIMNRARQVLTVERASVFLKDEDKKELWSILTDSEMATRGDNVIRVKVGVGIAGTVAKTGEMLNIDDVYSSPLFNDENDRVTGFSTKSCLCVPIRVSSRQGLVIGVMQYINKINGHPFDEEDCSLATTFSTFVGISLNNVLLYDELREGHLVREQNKELVRLRDKAKQAADAKANFLMSMSHEIRTPMSGVIGMTDLLEQTTQLDREQIEMVTTIKNCGESLLAIINDILDFGRLESGKMELERSPMCLLELAESTMDVIRGKAEPKSISMHLEISPQIHVAVMGDPFRLKQVLINLLGNAVKFTPDNGEIVVRVFTSSKKQDVLKEAMQERNEENDVLGTPQGSAETVMLKKANSSVMLPPIDAPRIVIEVRDTGIGIPSDKHSSLFLPFHQASAGTTRQYGGSGLGLSICKQLIEAMGGNVAVESEVGQGSAFSVVVPFQSQTGKQNLGDHMRSQYPVQKNLPVWIVSVKDCQQSALTAYFSIFAAKCECFNSADKLCEFIRGASKKTAKGLIVLDQSTLPDIRDDVSGAVKRIVECLPEGMQMRVCVLTQIVDKTQINQMLSHREDTIVLSTPPKFGQLASVLLEVASCGTGQAGASLSQLKKEDNNTSSPETTAKKVLVAEDNKTNQLLIKKQLGQFGIQPTICDNGKIAIEALLLEEHHIIFMGMLRCVDHIMFLDVYERAIDHF